MANRTISIASPITKIAASVALILLLVIAYFCAKWGFANTLSHAAPTIDLTEYARELSPNDGQTHLSYARDLEQSFDMESFAASLKEYEAAVALSPNNFNYWIALGQARERDGDRKGAENAFRRALSLAPNYARTNWALGNNLVRQENAVEGFALIRKAVESDPTYSGPAITAALLVFDGDIQRSIDAVGSGASTFAEAAKYLVSQKQYSEAVQVWRRVPLNDTRATMLETGTFILNKLIEGKQFRYAVAVATSLADDEAKASKTGVIANGGFENGVQDPGFFDWQIGPGAYPQIALTDKAPAEGKYSIFMGFGAGGDQAFRALSRTVAVEPGGRYRLTLKYKSGLTTRAVFKWEIADVDGKAFAATEPLTNTGDWAETSVVFTAPADQDAILIRTMRENCGAACTVSGNIFFDDMRLTKE
jgi:tetratricopeptide (TPR) repeat protein